MSKKKFPKWHQEVNAIFANLSNAEIKLAMERLIQKNFPNDCFLASSNRYVIDTVNRVAGDFKKRPLLYKRRDISDYIAASTINHCSDSWNYLARAVESIISGDFTVAIHLSYYSELRSVMSLMAYEGVGIFNSKHIWFDKNFKCHHFSGSTHPVADYIINKWAEQADKKDLIFGMIKVGNKPLSEWVVAAGLPGRSKLTKQILKQWLSEWSIDLKMKKDQDIRNEVSYRPKIFYQDFDALTATKNIREIWDACEPSGAEKFRNLDHHFLRIVLSSVYRFKKPGHVLNGDANSKAFVEEVMGKLGLSINTSLVNFLSYSSSPNNHFVIGEAKKVVFDPTTMKYDPFPILSRALLLLRLATATTEYFIEHSTISSTRRESLKFWWNKLCLTYGIIGDENEISDFNDLYADIADSFNNIDFSNAQDWASSKAAGEKYADEFAKIKQFHRAFFWGLAL